MTSRSEQPKENPPMICASFHRLSIVQPENCYNCVHRHGYPQYLFGDENCDSFIDTSSRPHPAPAFKRCCDSCINVPCKVLNRVPCLAQEKQENICEENGCTDVENCDEICQHSRLFSPLQMQEAKDEAARKAREDVLDKVIAWKRKHGYWFTINGISGEKRYHFEPDRFEEFIKEIRHTAPQSEQEQPR